MAQLRLAVLLVLCAFSAVKGHLEDGYRPHRYCKAGQKKCLRCKNKFYCAECVYGWYVHGRKCKKVPRKCGIAYCLRCLYGKCIKCARGYYPQHYGKYCKPRTRHTHYVSLSEAEQLAELEAEMELEATAEEMSGPGDEASDELEAGLKLPCFVKHCEDCSYGVKCNRCKSGYRLTAHHKCEKRCYVPYCKECPYDPKKCTKCARGYHKSGHVCKKVPKVPNVCGIKYCIKCKHYIRCTKCWKGYEPFLLGRICKRKKKGSYYSLSEAEKLAELEAAQGDGF